MGDEDDKENRVEGKDNESHEEVEGEGSSSEEALDTLVLNHECSPPHTWHSPHCDRPSNRADSIGTIPSAR